MKTKTLFVLLFLVIFLAGIISGVLIMNISNISKIEKEVTLPEKEEKIEVKKEEATKPPQEKKEIFGAEIDEIFKGIDGDIQWCFKAFKSGKAKEGSKKAVPSASVIKLFIMEYIYATEKEISPSLKGSINDMIIYSDNDAANYLINKYGMEKINSFIKEQGYEGTALKRKMLDEEARKNGIDNTVSAYDVMLFLEKLYNGRDNYPYGDMLDIMKKQTRKNKIPSRLPGDVTVANKTGEHDNVENDVGIIFTENDDVAVVFLLTDISDKGYAQTLIARAAEAIYEEFK